MKNTAAICCGLLAFLGLSTTVLGNGINASDAEQTFCSRAGGDIQAAAADSRNRLAFENQGGLFNQGVCWWHSRFQRAALYLAVFRPDLPRPTVGEANQLIRGLQRMEIAVIPGYSNLFDFSRDFGREIERVLQEWQLSDGILRFSWIDGLAGRTQQSAETLRDMMDRLYQRVNVKHEIVEQKLQLRGITAHAWLVIGMDKTEEGYLLRYIDSNGPSETFEYRYRDGDRAMEIYHIRMVAYDDYDGDLRKIKQSIRNYCR